MVNWVILPILTAKPDDSLLTIMQKDALSKSLTSEIMHQLNQSPVMFNQVFVFGLFYVHFIINVAHCFVLFHFVLAIDTQVPGKMVMAVLFFYSFEKQFGGIAICEV